MFDVAEFNRKIESSLNNNLDIAIENIKQNMINNNQIASGRTIESLHKEVGVNNGIIWGAEHIDTLETGISPQRSQMETWQNTWIGLMSWYRAKGFTTKEYPRKAAVAATNQRQIGSVLYRHLNGGRKPNVYTNEIPLLEERLLNELGEIIINTKIL